MTYKELKERIESFKNLKKGWDSYDGKTISRDCIKRAHQINKMILNLEDDILNAFVSPCGDGSILFELDLENNEHMQIWITKEKKCSHSVSDL